MSRILLRQALVTRLQKALDAGHVTVEAAAGYGKTVLLQQLAAHRPHSHLVLLTVADGDLPVLQERLAPWLGGEATRRTTLLLDDVHHLEGALAACEYLEMLVGRAEVRLLLAGRRIPLPATALTTVQRFDGVDLAFGDEESGAILQNVAGEVRRRWHQKLEGWPLGVGLLAQMGDPEDIGERARPELFHYLAQHVVDALPADLNAFLRATAALLRFNDELAAVVSGQDDVAALRRELQRRNLFIYDDERPGWYRYHELIRDFVLAREGDDVQPRLRRAIKWFREREEHEMAIEHAFLGGMGALAAEKLHEALEGVLLREGRLWSFRRWMAQLAPDQLRVHHAMLPPFIRKLHEAGLRDEAWRYMEQLQAFGEETGDAVQRAEGYWLRGFLYFNEARHEESLAALERAAAFNDGADEDLARRQTELLAHNQAGMNRLQEARRAYRKAIELAQGAGNRAAAHYSRHNLVNLVLIRQGRLLEAEEELRASDAFFEASGPYLLAGHLLSWAEVYQESGAWEDLARILQRQDEAMAQLEEWIDDDQLYVLWSRAILLTGQGALQQAQRVLDEALALPVADDLAQLCLATVQAWLYRRKGEAKAVAQFVDQTLGQYEKWPYWRALLLLERELARPTVVAPLPSELRHLVAVRAAPHLLRLRALLAIRCRMQGNDCWRRHYRNVLRGLRRAHYEELLTTRDPELGLIFWRIALEEQRDEPQADEALVAIGRAESLLPLLEHGDAAVRLRVANIVAAIGDERAMPALARALGEARTAGEKRALNEALARLEALPPPPLRIELMGSFAMWRGDERVPGAVFHRPIVLRLLQYFAVHRRQIVARDRILDDLWPDTPHEKAWATFRSVHSRLRRVLEPYMGSNRPVRYFHVEGESYQFDPGDLVMVDSEQLEKTVRATLREAGGAAVAPLPSELLSQLQGWQPLLPDLVYADWITETRQRLHDVYVEGCLYVAQAYLQRDEPEEAIAWAQKTIASAPWVETAYQVLMRAYARQGHRALALKVYSDVVQALASEFDVAPSPLTEWLRSRLESGDAI